jgi:antitoxin (DNA-binding transcriptional repressor) of toxin-antitoxin stability system
VAEGRLSDYDPYEFHLGSQIRLPGRIGSMRTTNLKEAKADLSRLVDRAASDEPFLIAKDGKPSASLPWRQKASDPPRIGFLAGLVRVPDDFDSMGAVKIEDLFAAR